jgi:opacity protein-like surface antigen
MFNRFLAMFALAVSFLTATSPAFSQVTPSATGRRNGSSLPLVVGGGFSNFDLDYGQGRRMDGVSAWADWDFNLDRLPKVLRGFGFEAEGHAIDFDRPASLVANRMRQDTGSGGVIYHFGHFRSFDPYVKYLVGLGSIDFAPLRDRYNHDTFTVYTVGGGAEYKIVGHFWARADYEFQEWHNTFGHSDLTPQGFTIGGSYHFRRSRN